MNKLIYNKARVDFDDLLQLVATMYGKEEEYDNGEFGYDECDQILAPLFDRPYPDTFEEIVQMLIPLICRFESAITHEVYRGFAHPIEDFAIVKVKE